jgi:hypothetical protein
MLVYNTISNICVPPSSIGVTYIPFSLLFSLDLVDGVITAFKQPIQNDKIKIKTNFEFPLCVRWTQTYIIA